MSNLEKSSRLLQDWADMHSVDMDMYHAARKLLEAELLAPDLPKPDSHDENGWPEWGDTEYMTYFSEHPRKGIPYISTPLSPWMDAESVRKEAYRLLAAAEWLDEWDKEHAEKEQDDGSN